MIRTLQLQNFRGIESVKFDDLALVNIIVGGNNTGKTSILEALTLLYGNQQQLEELPQTFRQSPNKDKDEWTNFWQRLVREKNYEGFKIRSDTTAICGKKDTLNDSDSDAPNTRGFASFYRWPVKDEQLHIFDDSFDETLSTLKFANRANRYE